MSQHKGEGLLKRVKRRWSPPPYNILENDAGPYPKNIEEVNLLDNTGYFSTVVYLKSLLQRSQLKTHKLSSCLSCCTSLSPKFFFFFARIIWFTNPDTPINDTAFGWLYAMINSSDCLMSVLLDCLSESCLESWRIWNLCWMAFTCKCVNHLASVL